MRQIGFFLVPIFFVVIGMQVDLTAFGGGEGSHSMAKIVSFTVVLTVLAIISKLAGCGLPALLVGFNARGAWRIGLGMLPRGEVALIVAGIGLASGVIERDIFGVAIIMTVITTVISPIMLVPAFRGASGQKNREKTSK
jgi:Kef-type K+ transport system membrane component KefB